LLSEKGRKRFFFEKKKQKLGAVPDNYLDRSFTQRLRSFKRVAGEPLLNLHSHSLRKR
jgi:hypothetical protein